MDRLVCDNTRIFYNKIKANRIRSFTFFFISQPEITVRWALHCICQEKWDAFSWIIFYHPCKWHIFVFLFVICFLIMIFCICRMIVSISWVSFWLRADAPSRTVLGNKNSNRKEKKGKYRRCFLKLCLFLSRNQYDVDIYYVGHRTRSNISQSELYQNVRGLVRCVLPIHFC